MPIEQPTFSDEELQSEIWKDVVGYEGHYEVSNLGRVKSLKNYHGFKPGKILKVSPTKNGHYLKVTFSVACKLRTYRIADLVAAAFIGPKPVKHETNHIDGAKRNNRSTNLEYLTKKGNMEHAARLGLTPSGARHGLRLHPDRAARGKNNGMRTHPRLRKSRVIRAIPLRQPDTRSFPPVLSVEDLAWEEWREIPGYLDCYAVSNLGRIKSLRPYNGIANRILRPSMLSQGRKRLRITLYVQGRERTYFVHQLVALAFIGPCPANKQPNHKDGNKLNNRASNLEYLTARENIDHAMALGLCPSGDAHYSRTNPEKLARGERHGQAKVTDEQRAEIRRRYLTGDETYMALGSEFGLHWSTVARIVFPQ